MQHYSNGTVSQYYINKYDNAEIQYYSNGTVSQYYINKYDKAETQYYSNKWRTKVLQ
jgi:hypothetical protein